MANCSQCQRHKAHLEELSDAIPGVYPQAITGGPNAYEKRTERMEGWNEAISATYKAMWAVADRYENQEIDENLTLLLGADIGFVREGTFYLNMNDTWAWACADAEEVPTEQYKEVVRLFKRYGYCGLYYWVSCRNNNLRSEFYDINRMIDFVTQEENLVNRIESSSTRAYTPLRYTIGIRKWHHKLIVWKKRFYWWRVKLRSRIKNVYNRCRSTKNQ